MKLITTREVVGHFVPIYASGRTLDIGGGTSKYRTIIKKIVTNYTVSDLYGEPGVDVITDARKMSFEDGSFNSIVSFQVLEHIDDTTAVVGEMYRVLKRGGHAIVTAPFLFPEHGHPSDYQRFTVEAIRFYFERAGFIVVEIGKQGSTWSVLSQIIRCVFLNPCVTNHGRIRRGIFSRVERFLGYLDRKGIFYRPDLYANVYVVAQKPL